MPDKIIYSDETINELINMAEGGIRNSLEDQLIAIEALGKTKSKEVLYYLESIRKNFSIAKGKLDIELARGLKKTKTFEQSHDRLKGVFIDNAYVILGSAIEKLKEDLKNRIFGR